jgi:Flp pilus assembly protein TadB
LDAQGAAEYAFGWFVGCFGFLPLGIWAQLGAPTIVWVPAAVAGIGGLTLLAAAVRTSSRSTRAANEYVGKQLGYRVELTSVAYSIQARGYSGRWTRAIIAARAEHQRRVEQAQTEGACAAVEDALKRRRQRWRLAVPAVVMIGFVVGVFVVSGIALIAPSWSVPIIFVAAFLVCAGVPAAWVRVRRNDSLERLREEVTEELSPSCRPPRTISGG